MGQDSAIAGVTVALRALLDSSFKALGAENRHLADVMVTAMPVDRARSVHHRCQLNVTLATVQAQSGRSGLPLGLRGGPPADQAPPQTVDLLYLVTAYGPEDDEIAAQRVMGAAMRTLHEQPVIGPIDLSAVFPHTGATGTLERLRVAQAPLTREQIIGFWLAFHTPYRLSTAWQISGLL
jgi:hypothetical protein